MDITKIIGVALGKLITLSLFLALSALLSSCMSNSDLSKVYLTSNSAQSGVESFYSLRRRVSNKTNLKNIKTIYGRNSTKFIRCSILRNQFFVASLKGGDEALKSAALEIETGYQTNDDAFLRSCDMVSSLPVGKMFLETQKIYWR